MNFKYIIREPQLNSGFEGMVAEMLMGLSDVGWSQLYVTEWRWQRFDLTTSYDEDKECIMVSSSNFVSQPKAPIATTIYLHISAPKARPPVSCDCSVFLFHSHALDGSCQCNFV